jgi:hypothetical protein
MSASLTARNPGRTGFQAEIEKFALDTTVRSQTQPCAEKAVKYHERIQKGQVRAINIF